MLKLGYKYINVRFSKKIISVASPTKAACCKDSHQGCGAGIGFIDIGRMVSGQVSLHSIAERAYVAYRQANDTSIAQLASSISGDDFSRHKRQSDTTGQM
jgi:hypothetical protein